MKQVKKLITTLLVCSAFTLAIGQEEEKNSISNIQEYTPSKLLKKGQWDIKLFNSIYTQTEQTDAGSTSFTIPRQTFFTNTFEVYTGVSENSRINVGLIMQVRSNTYGGRGALEVFNFKNNEVDSRSGLTAIAPSIRVQPFKNIGNFSFTSSLYLPLFKDTPNAAYLDRRSYTWETKFFYDKTFGANKWQVFTEVDLGFNFGETREAADPLTENIGERFANNSLSIPLSAFLSYFPTSQSTIFVNAQQAFLVGYDNPSSTGDNFSQNYTSVGMGGKYQITKTLNLEASFGKFIRGSNFQGLGQTFSLGLRALL
jgi:hypothetical protein